MRFLAVVVSEVLPFRNQVVAVCFRGLLEQATNLRAKVGDSEDLLIRRCDGWWIGKVQAYWTTDGDYVEAGAYVEPVKKGKQSEQEEASVKGKVSAGEVDSSSSSSEDELPVGVVGRVQPKRKPRNSIEEEQSSPPLLEEEPKAKRTRSRPPSSTTKKRGRGPEGDDSPVEKSGGGQPNKTGSGKKLNVSTSKTQQTGKGKAAEGKGRSVGSTSKGKLAKDEEDKMPKVVAVKVAWMAGFTREGNYVCLLGEPLSMLLTDRAGAKEPEYVTDRISRYFLCYEEPKPGKITINPGNRCLNFNSYKVLKTHAPNVMVNQAGETVGVGRFSPLPGEEEQWEGTLEEVRGFAWKAQDEGIDLRYATLFKVVGLRRWQDTTYVVISCNETERQLDHYIWEVRDRMFYCEFAVHHDEDRMPHFLQWPQLRHCHFVLNLTMLEANLESYQST